ncbi:Metallo-dependent phosphatase [Meira miltonrushii]|uniref:Metallo-dependent phosphatase n=1 Tax=Meira miltonrushii TaxID=1280837 RepID=A0A316V9X2_9BASI|nr:Metallo-dependent phosphatase [Meira miltonrushii]PWN32973.1 Metallo-dependent phosphatase [Meira miltonrushii]
MAAVLFLLALLCGLVACAPTRLSQSTLMARSDDCFKGHPYPANLPLLQFKPCTSRLPSQGPSSSSFKVMVITDTHLLDDQTVPGNASNVARASRNAVRTYISQEQPDFVVHLGDMISGEAANNTKDVQSAIREILSPMKDKRIPFSTTKGNHDNEKYSTHGSITDIERNYAPSLSYTRKAPANVGGGEYGTDNYWIPIFQAGPVDPNKTAPKVLLWFFDSRAGRKMLSQGYGPVNDWVDDSVADWITSETEKMEKAWGHVPPGLIFVHIPVHEHYTTQNDPPYADHVGGVPDETPANYTNKGLAYQGLNDDKPLASQGQESDQGEYSHRIQKSQ